MHQVKEAQKADSSATSIQTVVTEVLALSLTNCMVSDELLCSETISFFLSCDGDPMELLCSIKWPAYCSSTQLTLRVLYGHLGQSETELAHHLRNFQRIHKRMAGSPSLVRGFVFSHGKMRTLVTEFLFSGNLRSLSINEFSLWFKII